MKVKLIEIYSSVNILNKLVNVSLPAKTSYKFVKVMQKFNDELKVLEEERQKLIKKYGAETEGSISVTEENKEAFIKEFSDLMEMEMDIDWDPISIDAFGDAELSVADIAKIEFLLKE